MTSSKNSNDSSAPTNASSRQQQTRIRFAAVTEVFTIERYNAADIQALSYNDDDYRRFRTEDIISLTRKTRARVREMKRRAVNTRICQSSSSSSSSAEEDDESGSSTRPTGGTSTTLTQQQRKTEEGQLEMAMAA